MSKNYNINLFYLTKERYNDLKVKCFCNREEIFCLCFIRELKILKNLTYQTKDNCNVIYSIFKEWEDDLKVFECKKIDKNFLDHFFKQLNKKKLSVFIIPKFFKNKTQIFNEIKFALEKCGSILENNNKEIQFCFNKMYEYSLLRERKFDVINGHLFEKQYNFKWIGIEKEYKYMSIFSYLKMHFTYLIELLVEIDVLFLIDLNFKKEINQLLCHKKITIIKSLLILLKEYYLKDIINYGSLYENNFSIEDLLVDKLFNFIFKLNVFTKEEILSINYILYDLYCWNLYRDTFINCDSYENEFNFSKQLLGRGTENMRINVSKNLSIIPLEYFEPSIDIYMVFKKIVMNKEWRVHPIMLSRMGFNWSFYHKHYFNYSEIDVMEKIVQFYWEEFIKNSKIGDKKKLEKKYWYIDYWSSFNNFETINEDFKKHYLNKEDYIVGEEWDEETKDWKNFSDSISDEIIRGIKYWGWEEYRSRRGMEFSFEEYVGMNNLNITWEDVSKNA